MTTQLGKHEPLPQGKHFDITGFAEFEAIESALHHAIADSEGIVRDMCLHILNAGGKRIRPLLVLYSGNLFSDGNKAELLQTAVAAELIHMASLVHDDIIDGSPYRRNKPSVNKVWGNHFAVLCGDYLFAKAFGLLSDPGAAAGMSYMVEAIQGMCYGEILQASDKYVTSISLEAYYNKIAKKTALFIARCCKAGAVVAGADGAQTDLAGQYGMNLGYAFQITDDVLDFCGDAAAMGKPAGEDLMQGILTLPVILLLRHDAYGPWIRQMIQNRAFSDENIHRVKLILEETGSIKKSYEIAEYHMERAKAALRLLPQSRYTDMLSGLADMLQTRVN